MLRTWVCDLHIHTCLSPCADRDMTPGAIVRMALQRGIDLIAICDHNASENVTAVSRLAAGHGVRVLPGMELTTTEEVHVLALFDTPGPLAVLQRAVYRALPDNPAAEQLIMNERDEVIGHNRRLLLDATSMPLAQALRRIHRLGGIAIAAHVDRPGFSILGQLGYIPAGTRFDALEISSRHTPAAARQRLGHRIAGYPLVTSSDAHNPAAVGTAVTSMRLHAPTVQEIRMAFAHVGGRTIEA